MRPVPNEIKKRLKATDCCGAGATVAIVAAAVAFGIIPLRKAAKLSVAQAAELHDQLTQLDGVSKKVTQVQADLDKTQARLAAAESRLPSTGAMDDFMRQVAKVAEDSGLQVDGISPQQLVDAGDYNIMPVTIAGVGSFDNCYNFLTGLRKMNRLTRLDDLTIEQSEPGNDPTKGAGQCRISVAISTFMAR
jgi:Tfp pilus assembly protein PilO